MLQRGHTPRPLTNEIYNPTIRNMSNTRINIEHYAERFKALSNPHRLALFQRLTSCCAPGTSCELDHAAQLSVGQLGAEVDIAPSTLSHHLKELNRAGLVQMERRGKQVICWVEPSSLEELAELFTAPLNLTKTRC